MRQTNEYGLSQWEKQDRILMEDFNGDNAKVDAELARLRSDVDKKVELPTLEDKLPWVKLGEATLGAAADQVAVSVPNAEKYSRFFIRYDVSGSTQAHLTWTGGGEKLLAYETTYSMLRCAGMVRAAVMPKGGVVVDFAGGHSTEEDDGNDFGCVLLGGAATSGTITIGISGSNTRPLNAGSFLDVYGFKK